MRRFFKILSIIIACIIAFVLLVLAIVYFTTGDSRKVFEEFSSRMTQGNAQAVYALMHPALVKVVKGTQTERALGNMCDVVDFSYFGASSSTDDGVNLNATLTHGDGTEANYTMNLVEHEGSMKVFKFEITPFCVR